MRPLRSFVEICQLLLEGAHKFHPFQRPTTNDQAQPMKRSFGTMEPPNNASSRERSVRFSQTHVVHTIDCSGTTKELFYGKRDFAQFQTEYFSEEKQAGNLVELQRRKRRQLDYQYETVAEIRRKRIEERILYIIHQGPPRDAESTDHSDICFQQRCIPLQRVALMSPSSRHQSGMAHAA